MQLKSVVFTFVYCFVVSRAILGAIKLAIGLGASREDGWTWPNITSGLTTFKRE